MPLQGCFIRVPWFPKEGKAKGEDDPNSNPVAQRNEKIFCLDALKKIR